jgi:hypothetical protein
LCSAHITAQALVETVDLKQISAKNQEKINLIIQWLLCILKAQDLPLSDLNVPWQVIILPNWAIPG